MTNWWNIISDILWVGPITFLLLKLSSVLINTRIFIPHEYPKISYAIQTIISV